MRVSVSKKGLPREGKPDGGVVPGQMMQLKVPVAAAAKAPAQNQDGGAAEPSKKRKHDEAAYVSPDAYYTTNAMPYMPRKEKELWTDLGDGLKHRSFDAGFMERKMPNIGLKLCGSIGNKAEIVAASERAVAASKHDAASLVLYK